MDNIENLKGKYRRNHVVKNPFAVIADFGDLGTVTAWCSDPDDAFTTASAFSQMYMQPHVHVLCQNGRIQPYYKCEEGKCY